MSEGQPVINMQNSRQDVQFISYLVFFKLAWFILVVAYPALKTYSVINETQDQRANSLRVKWAYYWVTTPFLIMLYKVLVWIFGNLVTFHIINLLITFILTKNNGYYIRHITIILTAKFYKNYYKLIKKIPNFIGNIVNKVPILFVSLMLRNKKQEKSEKTKVPRRTNNSIS